MSIPRTCLAVAALAVTALAGPADGTPLAAPGYGDGSGTDLLGLTGRGELVRFTAARPDRLLGRTDITGLAAGERLIGMDLRPANGQIYAVSNRSRVLVLDPDSGAASPVGRLATRLEASSAYGVDVNPAADRLRIVSNRGQNLRVDLNPNPRRPGVLGTTVDGRLRPASARIGALAYDGNTAGSQSTTLYDVDPASGRLLKQSPPNDGNLVPIGRLGVPLRGNLAFDIAADGQAVLSTTTGRGTDVHTVNLTTGRATRTGTLPVELVGVAALPRAARTALALAGPGLSTGGQRLLLLDRETGVVHRQVGLRGLATEERVVGIDLRPATGEVVGLTDGGRLVTIAPLTGVITTGPALSPALDLGALPIGTGTGIGMDVNPVVDRLRIVTQDGNNLRVDMDSGAVTVDGRLAGSDDGAVAAAYANPLAGATRTALFDLVLADALALQAPPNDGRLTRIGETGWDVGITSGLDIAQDGYALGLFPEVEGPAGADLGSVLARVDLRTGAATDAMTITGILDPLLDITLAPRGAYLP